MSDIDAESETYRTAGSRTPSPTKSESYTHNNNPVLVENTEDNMGMGGNEGVTIQPVQKMDDGLEERGTKEESVSMDNTPAHTAISKNDDEFGDFGNTTTTNASITSPTITANNNADDDFGDFGNTTTILPSTQQQVSTTDDDFGDFGNTATAIPSTTTANTTNGNDDFDDFGAASSFETTESREPVPAPAPQQPQQPTVPSLSPELEEIFKLLLSQDDTPTTTLTTATTQLLSKLFPTPLYTPQSPTSVPLEGLLIEQDLLTPPTQSDENDPNTPNANPTSPQSIHAPTPTSISSTISSSSPKRTAAIGLNNNNNNNNNAEKLIIMNPQFKQEPWYALYESLLSESMFGNFPDSSNSLLGERFRWRKSVIRKLFLNSLDVSVEDEGEKSQLQNQSQTQSQGQSNTNTNTSSTTTKPKSSMNVKVDKEAMARMVFDAEKSKILCEISEDELTTKPTSELTTILHDLCIQTSKAQELVNHYLDAKEQLILDSEMHNKMIASLVQFAQANPGAGNVPGKKGATTGMAKKGVKLGGKK